MKTVLYGGAFDPVHAGHIFVGHEALRLMAPSILILIPTGLPNPDFDKRLFTSDADRVAMLRLAFAGVPDVTISDFELSVRNRKWSHQAPLRRQAAALPLDQHRM